jgi:hypothetical protein
MYTSVSYAQTVVQQPCGLTPGVRVIIADGWQGPEQVSLLRDRRCM